MKRDIQLIRLLLLWIEEHHDGKTFSSRQVKIEGYSLQEIDYHLRLLQNANFIDKGRKVLPNARMVHFSMLTSQGCDLLDRIRTTSTIEDVKIELTTFARSSVSSIGATLITDFLKRFLGL